jgi:alanine racemase
LIPACRAWGWSQPNWTLSSPRRNWRSSDLRFLISHLACADEPANAANADQAARFRAIAERFPGLPRALDNSGGCF